MNQFGHKSAIIIDYVSFTICVTSRSLLWLRWDLHLHLCELYTLTTTLTNLDNNYNIIKQSNFNFKCFETSIDINHDDNTTAVESGTVY